MKRNGLQRSKLSLVCFSLFMLLTCTQMVQAADDAEDSTNPAVEAKEAASAPKTEKKERMPSETVQVRPKNAGPDARFFRIEPDIVTNLNYQKKFQEGLNWDFPARSRKHFLRHIYF